MEGKSLWPVLALICSGLFLSCSGGGQDPRVAVFAFGSGAGVPDGIVQKARETASDRIIRSGGFDLINAGAVDATVPQSDTITAHVLLQAGRSLEANVIITVDIRRIGKDGIMDRFADRIRGNTAWYEVEMRAIDVSDGSTIATVTGTFDDRLRRLDRRARRLVRQI